MDVLEGRVAAVTGAGAGIGRAEALSLASHGAAVVVNDVVPEMAADVVATIVTNGGRAVANSLDVSLWRSGQAIVDQAVAEFGSLDILVTNAGVVRRNYIVDVSEAEFDTQVGVLFKGTYGLIRHAAVWWRSEHRAGRGTARTVVATSSSAGVPGGVEEFSVYGAMKAGIAAFALGAALEFRPFGVTVNAILPHAATAMNAAATGLSAAPVFEHDDPSPLNPQHVANAVTYLASPRASWLSGQVFEVTGTNIRRWTTWSPGLGIHNDQPWTTDTLDLAMSTEVYQTLPSGRIIPNTNGLATQR